MDGTRDQNGRFVAGHPGGPGRPKGSAAAEFREAVNNKLMDIIERVAEQALEGNLQAARLILDRTHPVLQSGLSEIAGRLDELEDALSECPSTPDQQD